VSEGDTLESCDSILARTTGIVPITDDNIGEEYSFLLRNAPMLDHFIVFSIYSDCFGDDAPMRRATIAGRAMTFRATRRTAELTRGVGRYRQGLQIFF